MPRFDGTGPQGRGAGTGRGFGFCFHDWIPVNSPKNSIRWVCRRCGNVEITKVGVKPKTLILK